LQAEFAADRFAADRGLALELATALRARTRPHCGLQMVVAAAWRPTAHLAGV